MPGHRVDTPTTTVERLGIKPGLRVWLGGHGQAARAAVEQHLAGTERPPEGPLDLAFITPETCDEAVHFAQKLRRRLVAAGMVWVVHPNDRSPHAGGFKADSDDLVVGMFELGLVQVGVAPVGNDFAALGFRIDSSLDVLLP